MIAIIVTIHPLFVIARGAATPKQSPGCMIGDCFAKNQLTMTEKGEANGYT